MTGARPPRAPPTPRQTPVSSRWTRPTRWTRLSRWTCLLACGAACLDAQTDRANCGRCGNACGGSLGCVAGVCACPTGQSACGTTCRDLQGDNAHCGGCGRACAAGETCAGGICDCPAGQERCGGVCRAVQTDANHCGACGTVCAAPAGGTASCVMGACVGACPSGQTSCGGTCRVTGGACTSAGTGGCQTAGTTICAGTCRDVATDNAHCGACGRACAAGQVCSSSVCTTVCAAGQTQCGMQCVSTATSTSNCGACGRVCTPPSGGSALCGGGTCVSRCPSGTSNCGGVCRPTGASCVAGDLRYQGPGETVAGVARVYYGGPKGIEVNGTPWTRYGQSYDRLGWDLATAGDVNGDGRCDLLVYSNEPTNRASWYIGTPIGLSSSPNQSYTAYGTPVSLGDITGDGSGEVAFPRPSDNAVEIRQGGTMVPLSAPLTQRNSAPGFGRAISAGDVNGDGITDLIVLADRVVTVYSGILMIADPIMRTLNLSVLRTYNR